jgi:predicted RNase H-like HicB family nuclease
MADKHAPRFTAQLHRDGEWWVAFCPEMPEANGQGRTEEEAVGSLMEAIELLIEDRRTDALKSLPQGGITRDLVFA